MPLKTFLQVEIEAYLAQRFTSGRFHLRGFWGSALPVVAVDDELSLHPGAHRAFANIPYWERLLNSAHSARAAIPGCKFTPTALAVSISTIHFFISSGLLRAT